MTQEDKKILLKDLCARLAYGVFIHYHWSREGNTIDEDRELDFSDVETLKYNIENPQNDWCEISWKPYLRPMSSMTEEEVKEIRKINWQFWKPKNDLDECFVGDADDGYCSISQMAGILDYLNAHHFDYRGLIEKGLALEAPEGMYG